MIELFTWTATGLVVGWLVRKLMRSRRDFGLVGDLITGWLGGVVGGWIFRRLDFIAPDNAMNGDPTAICGITGWPASRPRPRIWE